MPTEKEMLSAVRELSSLEDELLEDSTAYSEYIAPKQARASALRAFILAQTFDSQPSEGKTKYQCPGFELICDQGISRTVDEPALSMLEKELRKKEIPLDKLIRVKKELNLRPYRTLKPAQMKMFDRCLIIKPNKPTLTVIPYAGQ